MAVDGDPNKYYDSYTKKESGSVSVTAWVQAPAGEVISGTVKFFMTNSVNFFIRLLKGKHSVNHGFAAI